jgi:hypothetical protein
MLGSLRRILAGVTLMVAGVALWWVIGLPPLGRMMVLPAALAVAGVAVLSGAAWGRPIGLVMAGLGLVVGIWCGLAGTGSPLAALVFSPADAGRWYVVMPTGYGLAILSGIAGTLLIAPFDGRPRVA